MIAIINLEQKDLLVGQEFSAGQYFNPVLDKNGKWVISEEEINACVSPDFQWIKSLVLSEYVAPDRPPIVGSLDVATFQNGQRSFTTAYKISETRQSNISVSVSISCVLSVTGGQSAKVELQISPDGVNWTAKAECKNTSTGTIAATSAAYHSVGFINNITGALYSTSLDIYGPNKPEWTTLNGQHAGNATIGATGNTTTGWLSGATQYDGLTFYPVSGTLSGSITIFGYNTKG